MTRTTSLSLFAILAAAFGATIGTLAAGCSSSSSPNPVTSEAGSDVGPIDGQPPGDSPSGDVQNQDVFELPQGQISRVGRVEAKTFLVFPANRNDYNALDTFGDPTAFPYDIDLQTRLTQLDLLDGTDDWKGGGLPPEAGAPPDGGYLTHPLGPIFKIDALLVDTAKPYSATGYLELEQEMAGGPAHTTCGGRTLNEDVIDKQLSYTVKKAMTGVSDGVAGATKPATQTFPYLAPPN